MLALALCLQRGLVRQTTYGGQHPAPPSTDQRPAKWERLVGLSQVIRTGPTPTLPDRSCWVTSDKKLKTDTLTCTRTPGTQVPMTSSRQSRMPPWWWMYTGTRTLASLLALGRPMMDPPSRLVLSVLVSGLKTTCLQRIISGSSLTFSVQDEMDFVRLFSY